MSKSDAQRRSYLADQMTVMERVEAIERRVADLESSGTTRPAVRYLDPVGNIVDRDDPKRAASPTECGRIVLDASEWDRLRRIEEAADSLHDAVHDTEGGRNWLKPGTHLMGRLSEALGR